MTEKTSILDIQINATKALKAMSDIEDELEELQRQQKEIKDSSWMNEKQLKSQNEQYAKNAAKIKVLNQEMQGYNRQLVNQIKAQRENDGSLTSMRAKLSDLRKQYDELDRDDREAEGGKGQQLLEEITQINNELTKAEEKSGRFQRNVGNYYGAIMASARDLMAGSGPTRPVGPMGSGGGGGNTENIKRQLKEMRDLQQQLQLAGKAGTKEFEALSKAIGDAKDQVADLEAETTHYASDTAKLDELKSAFGATGSAVAGVGQTMEMFGASAESVNAVEGQLASGTGIFNSAIAVQNALQKQSVVMLGIKRIQTIAATKAEALQTKTTIGATVAQKAFNLVAEANPYVLLAAAVLTVVGALVAFSKGTQEVENNNEEAMKEARENMAEEQKKWMDMLDARKKAKFAQEQFEVDAMKDGTQKQIAQENLRWKLQQDAEFAKLKLFRFGGTQREMLQKQFEVAEQQHNQKLAEINKKASEDADKLRKAAIETARKEQRAAQDAEIANMKDGFDKQRVETIMQYNRRIEDLKRRLATEENLNASARSSINKQIVEAEKALQKALKKINDDERIDALNKEKDLANLRLESLEEGSEEYLNAKLKALHRERDIELSNTESTEEQKQLIRDKYAKEEKNLLHEHEQSKREQQETDQEATNEAELLRMRNRGASEVDVLKRQAEQMWDAFSEMQQKEEETTSQYQLRVAQAYNNAMNAQKTADQAQIDMTNAKTEAFGQLSSAVSGVTSAMAEGTGADETAKQVTASLAVVSGAAALAQTIEKASKASTWYEAIAEVAASVAAFVPIISNIKTLAGYAEGGYVFGAGSGTSDSINARLSNGEYVVKANAVNASTLPVLNAMNGQSTASQVGSNNFLAQQMLLAFRSMPSPVVSVQDINLGQSRVSVIENSAKIL